MKGDIHSSHMRYIIMLYTKRLHRYEGGLRPTESPLVLTAPLMFKILILIYSTSGTSGNLHHFRCAWLQTKTAGVFSGEIHTCVGWQFSFVWHGTELIFRWRQALMDNFNIFGSATAGVPK